MRYHLAPIPCRPWLLVGLPLELVESHYENNYGGALRRLNNVTQQLEALDPASSPPALYNALKREELAALNSTLLHELYFACLGGDGQTGGGPLVEALARDFGSFDRWRTEFTSMGIGLGGGSGWVVLTYIPRDKRLVNQFASDHTQSVPGGVPIIALDMYEHAYHMTFGANAKAYVGTFMRNLDWKAATLRYGDALQAAAPRPLEQPEFAGIPSIAVEDVKAMIDSGENVQIIDARPAFSASRLGDIVLGVQWRDPDRVQEWMKELSKSDPVVVYCVYGFHVGCRMAGALREAGFDARYMEGGHCALKALGARTQLMAQA
jgi:Fe-Mn family superoxide dismutase